MTGSMQGDRLGALRRRSGRLPTRRGRTPRPWAKAVVHRFNKSYAEVSPSGTGVHVLLLACETHVEALRADKLVEGAGRDFPLGEHVQIAHSSSGSS